ncbi:MAG: hypothetical protein A2992_03760 [Elusimicrobia bacterium RIFCSPLOWO2_01_FULL_59_12]|nr:MAG: hypothetical protein A2992_03760 [Elusimicrobia bacterium RIFCSPLOWO2_01_FULL_59_12]
MAYAEPLRREFSRILRKEQTDAEKTTWKLLRSRQFAGFKFRRQRVIGRFIADFCCLNPKLIIELDGSHHLDRKDYDAVRTVYLGEMGFRVIRFWDNQVLNESEAVTAAILDALTPALSHPTDGRGSLRNGESKA